MFLELLGPWCGVLGEAVLGEKTCPERMGVFAFCMCGTNWRVLVNKGGRAQSSVYNLSLCFEVAGFVCLLLHLQFFFY